ncbi:MAG: hypothetical protein JWN89_449 [Parcubacteria group bacterium]|nr:hypothetical protein [Parcubacteria group bacterium]
MEQPEPIPNKKVRPPEKLALWEDILARLDRVADKLGMPIDSGIKETVAAFVLNKFPTYLSCEGHVEERFGERVKINPYVGIGFDEPHPRYIGEAEIRDRIGAEHGHRGEEIEGNPEAARAYWDYIAEHDVPETPEYLALRAKNEELEKRAQEILEDFYEHRQAVEETKITTMRIGPSGHFFVTIRGEEPEHIPESEIEKYTTQLASQQEEMKALTEFLKKRFFE